MKKLHWYMTLVISHQVHRLSQSPLMSICKNILSQTYG